MKALILLITGLQARFYLCYILILDFSTMYHKD